MNKDALMVQAVFGFAQGCGGAEISEEASAWFHQRYYGWLDRPKGDGRSPQDVWATEGRGFIGRFKEIGRRAASSGSGVVEQPALETSALSVERESDCPWCPDI